jgi:hypothetical protein
MSTSTQYIIIAILVVIAGLEVWRIYNRRREIAASRNNEERWEWTDYRGFTYSIAVDRHVY